MALSRTSRRADTKSIQRSAAMICSSAEGLPTARGNQSFERASQNTNIEDSLDAFFPTLENAPTSTIDHIRYSAGDIQQIAKLLGHINIPWSRVPRTYILLRTVNQLHLLNEFIDLGFTDHWLPVSSLQLPESLSSAAKANFLQAQSIVLTKARDLESGEDGQHQHFGENELLPFRTVSLLGSGGFGQVEKVISILSNNEYARKRIQREKVFGRNRKSMKSYISELGILKRVDHRHIVKLIGSYTDPDFLGLVMSPVADCNLADYLSVDLMTVDKKQHLRTFFGCLTAALAYLHDVQIRHKDIKPQNILIKGDTILLTDFGLSHNSAGSTHSTTEGVTAMSPRYCAPEVASYEPRNSSADIWSLGCVFVEMVTVLKGQEIQSMRAYFRSHSSHGQFFSNNPEATTEWLLLLSAMEPLSDNKPLQWAEDMLKHDRRLRPRARTLVEVIQSDTSTYFCGRCKKLFLDGGGYCH